MTPTLKIISSYHSPAYATDGAAGLDLTYPGGETIELMPGTQKLVSLKLRIQLPSGHVGLLCPRSGLALRHGITLVNSPGIIDADYRGDIGVLLWNTGHKVYTLYPGTRIAQLVIMPVTQVRVEIVRELDDPLSDRIGGWGSTGA